MTDVTKSQDQEKNMELDDVDEGNYDGYDRTCWRNRSFIWDIT
jgi:hypothetical protein